MDWNATLANILMAIATFIIIVFTWRESKKGREFSRLREKLLFYSELMAGLPPGNVDTLKYFHYLQVNLDIQKKYPALVNPELSRLLEHIIPAARSHEEGSYDKVSDLLSHAMIYIMSDFHKLKEEYENF